VHDGGAGEIDEAGKPHAGQEAAIRSLEPSATLEEAASGPAPPKMGSRSARMKIEYTRCPPRCAFTKPDWTRHETFAADAEPMTKVSVVLRTAVMKRLVERLHVIGHFDFITFHVAVPRLSECLEWYGDDRDAGWVVRAVETVGRGRHTDTVVTVSPVDEAFDLDEVYKPAAQ
jgi:hypothetical protein